MKKKEIEQMLSGIDKKYIAEAIEAGSIEESKRKSSASRARKFAAAAVVAIVLGTGTTAAATSDVFLNWLSRTFSGHEITKLDITAEPQASEDNQDNELPDLPADQNSHLSLGDDMDIYGEKESFVCQYHTKSDHLVVDHVYSIQDNGLKEIQSKNFHGTYNGADFSFQYAIINQEIFGFNLSGNINGVFHYTDGETVYVQLCEIDEDTFISGCIAQLNLNTGTVTKLTDDKTMGNMMMSPNGKTLLINYRADGFWTAFDLESCIEKKMPEINGYAHTNEIIFQDDYHVITFGEPYLDDNNIEMTGTKIIDLRTGKKVASYQACGDYGLEWLYQQKKDKLEIKNVTGSISFVINGIKGYPHPLSSKGDYVLLGNLEDQDTPYYLCNLKEKSYMEIDTLMGAKNTMNMYLAAKEGKLLLSDGKDAYLVDISTLETAQ